MCKTEGDETLIKLGHQVRVYVAGLSNLPCHVGFQLKARGQSYRGQYAYPTRGYTLDIEVAKGWIDLGGRAEVCKLWEIPGGNLVAHDPSIRLPTFAWRPHRLGSAKP